MRRTLALLATAVLALAGTTACEPPPPPANFTVNVAPGVTGDDASPGDGVCETAPGNGQCTIDAAIEEGNALGRADIVLPAGADDRSHPTGDATITGQLTITGSPPGAGGSSSSVSLRSLRVAPGASLTLAQLAFRSSPESRAALVTVDGSLTLQSAALFVPMVVSESGSLTLLQAVLTTIRPAVVLTVRGTASLLYATVLGAGVHPAIDVAPSGQVEVGASQIRPSSVDACVGAPLTSLGHNLSAGSSCGLAGPGDVDADPFLAANRVDLIPAGVLGCGTAVNVDAYGTARPIDGDGDGIAACDAGPVETAETTSP